MRAAEATYDGEAVSVATIRRRRRAVTDADAIAIRDHLMLRCHIVDDLGTAAIAKVFGLGVHSVRDGLRRAKAAATRGRQGSRPTGGLPGDDGRQARRRSGAP